MISFEIEGDPIPWARPGIIRTRKTNIVYDRQRREKEMTQWRIKGRYRDAPLTVPLRIKFIFRMPIPKSTSAPMRREMINGVLHHSKRPDIDNLSKYMLDAMNGLIYNDDSQVHALVCEKVYSECPGTYVEITPETKNNHQDKEVEHDGYSLRDHGSGDVLRSHLDQERPKENRRKENCVLPFSDGGEPH